MLPPHFVAGHWSDLVDFHQMLIPPTLILAQIGIQLVIANNLWRALVTDGYVGFATVAIKLKFIVQCVQGTSDEDLSPFYAFERGLFHHLACFPY